MKKLIIKKLYILDLKDKKAYVQKFIEGINIITSDKTSGNNVGKSLIMKSIYHTLGADCYFSDRVDINSKTFVLEITIDDQKYYFWRFNNLFKIYNENEELVYETTSRKQLSEYLRVIFDFFVELPNKNTNELEITPPAYMYLLNYLDQDKMEGSSFSSFRNLQQYSNFKEKVLYNYFGIYNKEYYELEESINDLEKKILSEEKEQEIIESMLDRISKEVGEINYSSDTLSLEAEIENTKDEYVEIVSKLNESKSKIIELKNNKAELEMLIDSITKNIHYTKGVLKKFNKHTCPVCESKVDVVKFRYKQYDRNEDYLFLSQSVEMDLEKVIEELDKEKERYQIISQRLEKYNKKIREINKNVDNVIKHKGYIEMRDKLVVDLSEKKQIILQLNIDLKEAKKKFKIYTDKKKKVKESYYQMMSESVDKFGLKEIDKNKLKDIKNNISGSGSNIPICTMIWYLTLLKLKERFNPNAIMFPLVLDSPNNRELSENSRKKLFEYIFENYNEQSQLIISTLGFCKEDYNSIKNINVIALNNEPYHLLNQSDYDRYIEEYKRIIGFEKGED